MSSSSLAEATCEACGWAAAFCSMLAFGSYGVPIKSAVKVDTDPLVFQTYKTMMCFLTSWLVLLAGEKFVFTPWGIVSGLFWVPGGIAGIYGIQNAGLAIGIGIGSSLIVLVSFIWGIFIFGEEVRSRWGASFAVFCIMLGLVGMSYYSAPECDTAQLDSSSTSRATYTEVSSQHEDEEAETIDGVMNVDSMHKLTGRTVQSDSAKVDNYQSKIPTREVNEDERSDNKGKLRFPYEVVWGRKISKRHLGMLGAAFNGIWGGSIMAPMKLSKSDTKGVAFLISFAIGASIVNLLLWIFRYMYNYHKYKSMTEAYTNLPSFHFRVMWLAGGTCGLLWSIGNFFSLISVFYLGQGVGYPLVQAGILVSGVWGIFYFKEVTGTERIMKWLLSSLLTTLGILLLGSEKHYKR
jgi:glucose uptake protein GlcU